jgi:hypothetical protein
MPAGERDKEMSDMMEFDNPEIAQAAAEAKAAMTSLLAPSQTVTRAGFMLRMAQQGLRDMQETDEAYVRDNPDRVLLGFLGVVVFGRSMTFVMQNLRRHDRDAFDNWYSPWQAEMKDDPLMRYFDDLRTRVIHHDAPAIGILLGGFGANFPPIGSITIEGLPLPECHLGQRLDDTSMGDLCRLYVEYLQRMFDSFAPVAFAVQDRLIAAKSS